MSAIIYRITNKANGKCYVGQTTQGIKTRWYQHCWESGRPANNVYFHKAIRKYGKESFTVELLEETTVDILDDRERYWIAKLQPEYNMTEGGNTSVAFTGRKHTKETKERMSRAAKSHVRSKEHCDNISAAKRGKLYPQLKPGNGGPLFAGHKHTTECKKRISEASKRMWSDPDFRTKMKKARQKLPK